MILEILFNRWDIFTTFDKVFHIFLLHAKKLNYTRNRVKLILVRIYNETRNNHASRIDKEIHTNTITTF